MNPTTTSRHFSRPSAWFSYFLFILLVISSAALVPAQSPGELDLSFETGSTINGNVLAVDLTDDEKLYIAGQFNTVRGAARNCIARLNPDGTVDSSFDPGSGVFSTGMRSVYAFARQPDGRVLIGGRFTGYDGTARAGIARLNVDGSLDISFDPGSGVASGEVRAIALQPDGKILIAGSFFSYNGTAINSVARLNPDGGLDTTFNTGAGANSLITSLALQPDGKVCVGGHFSTYNGVQRNRIARINANGSLDGSFTPGMGASDPVNTVTLQSDGKIIIGGWFTTYDEVPRARIARLNTDGSLDTSFNPGLGASNTVDAIALQPDGKLLIGGSFTSYNGTVRMRIARLNDNGSLDPSLNPGSGVGGTVYAITPRSDEGTYIGGSFSGYGGVAQRQIARINTDGTLDPFLKPSIGIGDNVNCIATRPDGKVLIAGAFKNYSTMPLSGFARLNSDGDLDAGFNPGSGADQGVSTFDVLPNGKLMIGGWFTSYNGIARNRVARLNQDGSLDIDFIPGAGANSGISSMAVQPDGKVILVGFFTDYDNQSRNRIARINVDGTHDTTFNPGQGANNSIWAVSIQANGGILIGGDFTSFDGETCNRIARLNPDGSLDTTFNAGSGFNSRVSSLATQSDGKIIIGGDFTAFDGEQRVRIARINDDGSLDASFNPGNSADNTLSSIVIQADGKILVGGQFGRFNNIPRNRIARLNENGSVDTSFDPGTGIENFVNAIAIQPNGMLLVGGRFGSYNGIPRAFLARVFNDPAVQSLVVGDSSRIEWLRSGSTPEIEHVTFESSVDGELWIPLGNGTRISGGWELTGLTLPVSGQLRGRGRATGGGSNGSSSIIEQVIEYSFGPEISVSGNGLEIANGDATPATEDHTDFGQVSLPGGSIMRTFTITNLGVGDLTLSGTPMVEVSGSTAFSVTQQPINDTVAAGGGTQTFVIAYVPEIAGTHEAVVGIISDDSANNPFTFAIQGEATTDVPPLASLEWIVAPTSATPGDTLNLAFAVRNTGSQPASIDTVTVVDGPTWLTFTGAVPAEPLAPGADWFATFTLAVPSEEPAGTIEVPNLSTFRLQATSDGSPFEEDFVLSLYPAGTSWVEVTVVDATTDQPISGSIVAADDSAEALTTDGEGKVTAFLLPGARTISAYATGFLPGQEVLQVEPGANELTLALEPGEALGISGVTANVLSAEEIAARGVDLDDPENSLVYDFQLNTSINVLVLKNIVVGPDGGGGEIDLGDFKVGYSIFVPGDDPYERVEVWVVTPGTVQMLKQFWDVAVSVSNQTTAFVIEDAELALDLPSGLSLPDLFGDPQAAVRSFGNLAPGASATAEWVVRGDLPGTYQLHANATGDLKLGAISIPLTGGGGTQIEVVEPRIRVSAEPSVSEAFEGESFNLLVTVENLSPVALNGVVIELDPGRIENAELVEGETLRRVIGTIPANGQTTVSFELIPLVPEELFVGMEVFGEDEDETLVTNSAPRRFTISLPPLPDQQTALTTTLGLTLSEVVPGLGFEDWPLLATLPADKRGPLDRNGPLQIQNLLAYAMGLDSLAATAEDLPQVTGIDPAHDHATFRYRRAKNAAGVTLSPMTSTDLGGWQAPAIQQTTIIEDGGDWEVVEIRVTVPPAGKLFFQLQVE